MIEVIPYQARWRDEFRAVGQELRALLGALAVRIDHIGSTSVSDLAAKDIIDVQITLADFEKWETVLERMQGAGFVFRHYGVYDDIRPDWSTEARDWEKAYFRERDGQKRTHIHVRIDGRANQRYALIFRDYLRTHPRVAAHYADMKAIMVKYVGHLENRALYGDGKDPMVDLIALYAKEWAEQNAWQPGPSDA